MPKALFIFFVLSIIILSCRQPSKNITTVKDSIATVPGMPGYRYFDSTMSHNDTINYVDTFSVDGRQFRVVYSYDDSTDNTDNTKLEQLSGSEWQHMLTFFTSMHSGYTRTSDVNGDGYPDFLERWHYGSNAHFYLPAKKTFGTAVSFELMDWQLIDTARNIYCQNFNIKGHQEKSMLYTFDGVKPVILYTMEFEDDTAAGNPHVYKSMSLYKTVPGYKDSSILVNTTQIKPEDETDEFEYDDYWRRNYKELLGIK